MRRSRSLHIWLFALASYSLLLGAGIDMRANAAAEPVRLVIVVAKDFGASDISAAMLRLAFGGETVVSAGRRLIAFNYPPEHAARQVFDQRLLDMPPSQIGRYWIDRRIRGQGGPPRTIPSPEVMKTVVARLVGAIGYVTSEQLDASVRTLTVDGKSYRDPGYFLLGN